MVCTIHCFFSAEASHQYQPQAEPSVSFSSEKPLPVSTTDQFFQQYTALTSTTTSSSSLQAIPTFSQNVTSSFQSPSQPAHLTYSSEDPILSPLPSTSISPVPSTSLPYISPNPNSTNSRFSQHTAFSPYIASESTRPICRASRGPIPSLPSTSPSVPLISVAPSSNPQFTSPISTPSPPVISSDHERVVPRPLKRSLASDCDSLRERQTEEHNIKMNYWKKVMEMQEEERLFQIQMRKQKLKEAEGRIELVQNTLQQMEEGFQYLKRFLDAARVFYEAIE